MNRLEMNPYVIQIDKFVTSLEKLSHVFLNMEEKKEHFSEEEYREMYEDVKEKVCANCSRKEICQNKKRESMCVILREVVSTVENYGAELNVEIKRKIQKKCVQAPQLLKVILEVCQNKKKNHVWRQRMEENRRGCAVQLDAFAHMIQHSTRELNASIFEDDHLEKKLKTKFSKNGIKLLSTVFFVSQNGLYEIHVTVRTVKGQCVTTKELAKLISECTGRTMIPDREERQVVGTEYGTIICVESAKYHTLQGIARIGKGCEKISGDNFSMLELPGGQQGIILSDGMGAGESAFRESMMVVEVLEELLNAGFPKETALQMLNTAMVMGREEVRFSTIDMCIFDLYQGKCELVKAGASMTFVKRGKEVEVVKSTSLPLGVVAKLDIDTSQYDIQDGDLVIMVTDGVLDALPVGEQEFLLRMIIEGTGIMNPKELAHHILEQVLECSGEVPLDDMTVLVAGIWSLEK